MSARSAFEKSVVTIGCHKNVTLLKLGNTDESRIVIIRGSTMRILFKKCVPPSLSFYHHSSLEFTIVLISCVSTLNCDE